MDIARANRLDWMNNRMGVVDTWRLIYYNANQLKSGLNLTFSGALNTTNNNPVRVQRIDGRRGRRRAVLRPVDPPRAAQQFPRPVDELSAGAPRLDPVSGLDLSNLAQLLALAQTIGVAAGDPAPGGGDRRSPRRPDARTSQSTARAGRGRSEPPRCSHRPPRKTCSMPCRTCATLKTIS